jgi:hypothetical protein
MKENECEFTNRVEVALAKYQVRNQKNEKKLLKFQSKLKYA